MPKALGVNKNLACEFGDFKKGDKLKPKEGQKLDEKVVERLKSEGHLEEMDFAEEKEEKKK